MNEDKKSAADLIIKKWLDTRFDLAEATSDNKYESLAISKMKHLFMDDYWYTLLPEIESLIEGIEPTSPTREG